MELKKSDLDKKNNCLHLDCCLQPLGLGHIVVCYNALKNTRDISLIKSLFRDTQIIEISNQEMENLNSNFFSISSDVVVSDYKFQRLNKILTNKGYKVEEINYQEISKMGGLLRCSTLPLNRKL